MSNNEISYANYTMQIPTNSEFKSLNLSLSVIIVAQTVFNFLKGAGDTLVKWIRGTASKIKTAVQGGFKTLNKVRKTPIKQTLKSIKDSGIGKSVGNVINKIKTPKKTILELGKKISDSGVGKKTGNIINKIKNFKPGQTAKGMFTGIKNFGA